MTSIPVLRPLAFRRPCLGQEEGEATRCLGGRPNLASAKGEGEAVRCPEVDLHGAPGLPGPFCGRLFGRVVLLRLPLGQSVSALRLTRLLKIRLDPVRQIR